MDISSLVSQMQETLAAIHDTIAWLNSAREIEDEKLDELENVRDSTIQELLTAYAADSSKLRHKRRAEREEIAERRRMEDEERERRRRMEDEELEDRYLREDEARDERLKSETDEVEEETEDLMAQVEADSKRRFEKKTHRLRLLEERRQVWLSHLGNMMLLALADTAGPRNSTDSLANSFECHWMSHHDLEEAQEVAAQNQW